MPPRKKTISKSKNTSSSSSSSSKPSEKSKKKTTKKTSSPYSSKTDIKNTSSSSRKTRLTEKDKQFLNISNSISKNTKKPNKYATEYEVKNVLNEILGNSIYAHPELSNLIMEYNDKLPKYKMGDMIQIRPSSKTRSNKENVDIDDYDTSLGIITMVHKHKKTNNEYRYVVLTNKCKENTNIEMSEDELLLLYEDDINPFTKITTNPNIPLQNYRNQIKFISNIYNIGLKNKVFQDPHWTTNQIYLLENRDSIFPYYKYPKY